MSELKDFFHLIALKRTINLCHIKKLITFACAALAIQAGMAGAFSSALFADEKSAPWEVPETPEHKIKSEFFLHLKDLILTESDIEKVEKIISEESPKSLWQKEVDEKIPGAQPQADQLEVCDISHDQYRMWLIKFPTPYIGAFLTSHAIASFDGVNLHHFTLDKDLVCYGMMKEVEDGFVLEWTKNSRPERGRISNKKGPHMEIIKDETARKYFTNLVKRILAKSKTAELFPSRIQYELEIQYDKKYL